MSKTIINGIDVSECAYFNSVTYEEPYCNIDQEHLYTCSSDENCYYKQLKRLQEENEKLKKEKEKIEEDAEYFLNGDYCDEKCNSAKNELKYKQALEEISKVLEVYFDDDNRATREIERIISEVLNDRD